MITLVHSLLQFYRGNASDSENSDDELPPGWKAEWVDGRYVWKDTHGRYSTLGSDTHSAFKKYKKKLRNDAIETLGKNVQQIVVAFNKNDQKLTIQCFDNDRNELPNVIPLVIEATMKLLHDRNLQELKSILKKHDTPNMNMNASSANYPNNIISQLILFQMSTQYHSIETLKHYLTSLTYYMIWAGLIHTNFELHQTPIIDKITISIRDEEDEDDDNYDMYIYYDDTYSDDDEDEYEDEEEDEDESVVDLLDPHYIEQVAEGDRLYAEEQLHIEQSERQKRKHLLETNTKQIDKNKMLTEGDSGTRLTVAARIKNIGETLTPCACSNKSITDHETISTVALQNFKAVQLENYCFTWQDIESLDIFRTDSDGDDVINPYTREKLNEYDIRKLWYCYMYNSEKLLIHMPEPYENFIDEEVSQFLIDKEYEEQEMSDSKRLKKSPVI